MKAHEAEELATGFRRLLEKMVESDERRNGPAAASSKTGANSPDSRAGSSKAPDIAPAASERITDAQVEKLYTQIKHRLLDDLRVDPVFVQLLANVSEIVVELTPRVMTLDGDSLKGRVARLIAGGFFNEPKRQGAARSELVRTGPDCNSGNLSRAMTEFVADGFLTRDGESFVKAPGVKVTEKLIGVNV
jgi:hypothetical protein